MDRQSLLVSGRSAVRIRSPAPSPPDMRKRDQTEAGAPSDRCAQRLSSFRVACVALMMLAANRYVTRNGTFEPYHATITRIYRRLMDEHGMADVSYPAT